MTPNPFDRGARYAARLDASGFLQWLLPEPAAWIFHAWLDTRSLPFPGQRDRICDTVATLCETRSDRAWWALPIEFQTRPDAGLFGRLLEYLGRLWLELRPPGQRRGRFRVAAAVVNLTGRGRTSREQILARTGPGITLRVAERNLAHENADATLRGIAAGTLSRCLLPFIPLMHGGGEAGTIAEWERLAARDPDGTRRADYAGLALVFAELTKCHPAWQQALEGWNVEISQQVLEWQAQAEKRGRAAGKVEGRAQGLAEGKAEAVLRVLKRRFQNVPADVERAVRQNQNLAQLDQWLDAALEVDSLADFRKRLGRPRRTSGSEGNGHATSG